MASSSSSNEVAATPTKSLNESMKELFDSKDGSDIVFVIHGKELRAHRFIVGNRSPVLKAMIDGPMAPADLRHHIEDPEITFEDFENFLLFLYSDECNFGESKMKALLHLGNFYDVPLLLEKCVDKIQVELKENGDTDQIFRYAEMGIKYAPNSSLIQTCLQRLSFGRDFSLNYNTIDNELKWITGELVMEFVKKFPRNTTFTEDDVFKKVMEWAENNCHRQAQDVATENIREIMLPFMAHFDVTKFSVATVTTTLQTFKLLSDDQLIVTLTGFVVKLAGGSENLHHRRNGYNNDRDTPAQNHRGLTGRFFPADRPGRYTLPFRREFDARHDPADRNALPTGFRLRFDAPDRELHGRYDPADRDAPRRYPVGFVPADRELHGRYDPADRDAFSIHRGLPARIDPADRELPAPPGHDALPSSSRNERDY